MGMLGFCSFSLTIVIFQYFNLVSIFEIVSFSFFACGYPYLGFSCKYVCSCFHTLFLIAYSYFFLLCMRYHHEGVL